PAVHTAPRRRGRAGRDDRPACPDREAAASSTGPTLTSARVTGCRPGVTGWPSRLHLVTASLVAIPVAGTAIVVGVVISAVVLRDSAPTLLGRVVLGGMVVLAGVVRPRAGRRRESSCQRDCREQQRPHQPRHPENRHSCLLSRIDHVPVILALRSCPERL